MGEMADMIVDMWLDDEYVFDRFVMMHGGRSTFNERSRKFESLIKNNERNGIWQTNDGKKIPFEQLAGEHIKNIYTFLKRNDLYIPTYIRLYKDGKPNAFDGVLAASSLKGGAVIQVPPDCTCANCPMANYETEDYESMFGNTSGWYCPTAGNIDNARELGVRDPKCPIKKVI